MKGLLKFHVALLIVQVMYAANYVVAKGLMPDVVGPNGFILLRVLGATSLFWAILSFRREKISKADFGRLALCGLFGVALNQLMFFNGLMLTSPMNAPVIMTMTPIIVLVLSGILMKEKIRSLQILGVVLGAIGSVFFILLNEDGGFASGRGDIFILANATSYSFYLILVKPLMAKYRPLTVVSWVFTFGLLYVLIWAPSSMEVASMNWSEISGTEIAMILFVIIGVTFVPYLLNVFAMQKLSPSIAAVYIYLQPILATSFVYLFAYLGLKDFSGDMTWQKILCALAVFVGVYFVIKPQKKGQLKE
ncbi:MAG: drug/metabolite transporter (DMT)-like permease [Arenicella sp.]|jgi:drug/metabolite transporter (DMT)-like permease